MAYGGSFDRVLTVALAAALAGAAVSGAQKSTPKSQDWPLHNLDLAGTRYSTLDQIRATNVKTLVPRWLFQTGVIDGVSNQTTPVIVNGTMYVTDPRGSVYALDAADGHLLWNYDVTSLLGGGRREGYVFRNRGVSYADGGARPKPLLLRDERSPHHKYPKSVSSLGPGATGQPVPSKQDRHNVLEGSAMSGVVRSPGTETNLQAAIAMNDRCAPVSVYPAVIAARAGTGVAEPPVVGRRLLSMVDELGMRTHRGSRGEGGSMQGQSRGVRLETPPGPPMLAVETEDIRPEAEVPTEAWVGSRRGSYERRRRVMPLEQRAPTSVTLAREGRTA